MGWKIRIKMTTKTCKTTTNQRQEATKRQKWLQRCKTNTTRDKKSKKAFIIVLCLIESYGWGGSFTCMYTGAPRVLIHQCECMFGLNRLACENLTVFTEWDYHEILFPGGLYRPKSVFTGGGENVLPISKVTSKHVFTSLWFRAV